MNGHISVEARTKLAYDDLIVMSRLNPDHFQVHPSGQNKLLLIFLSPRPGWFYSYDRQGLVDSVHLEITFLPDQVTPHIRLLDPRPYHPNISQNEGGVLNINIMTRKDLKSQEKLTHLVAFIWDLLTYQFVDQNKILNENANKWYRKFRNNFPLTQMVLQLPPSSSGFHIISRSSPSTPLADFNHPKDVPSAIGEQNTLPQKNILPLTESIDTQNQQGYPNPKSNQEKPIESPSSTALSTGFKVKSIRKYAPPKQTFPADSSHENINWKYPVILVPQSVWNKILIHGSSAIGKEQFGILIGTVFENQNTNGVWLNVLDMVPATRPERSSLTYVEVSADEMAEMVRRSEFILDQNPNSCRLGWYHTHPGHGIFMSGTDKANHRAVYRTNWQVALVYDPNNHQFGFFSGLECTLIPANNIILVPDVTPTDKVIQPGYKETVSENIPTIRVPQKEPILIPEHSLGGSTPVTQHNSIPITKPERKPIPADPFFTPAPSPRPSQWIIRIPIYLGVLILGIALGSIFTRVMLLRQFDKEKPIVPQPTVVVDNNPGDKAILDIQKKILAPITLLANRGDLDEVTKERLIGQLQAVVMMDPRSKYGRQASDLLFNLRNKNSLTEPLGSTASATFTATVTLTPTVGNTKTVTVMPTYITLTPNATTIPTSTPVDEKIPTPGAELPLP